MTFAAIQWEPIVAVLIATIGWYVTHRSQLTAQKQQLRYQLLNEARIQITDALRQYQGWLTSLGGSLLASAVQFERREYGDIEWDARSAEWMRQVNSRPEGKHWLAALEEYEILLPELREVRLQLSSRHKELRRQVGEIVEDIDAFNAGVIPRLAAAGGKLRPVGVFVLDQGALLEDLRVHVQNRALGEIAEGTVGPRQPVDPSAPRLVFDGTRLTLAEKSDRAAESDDRGK